MNFTAIGRGITTRGLLLSRICEIQADELEELRITRPKVGDGQEEKTGIVARSDRKAVEFGRHLSPEEKEWIKTAMEHVLTV
jgi:hypothetical protein